MFGYFVCDTCLVTQGDQALGNLEIDLLRTRSDVQADTSLRTFLMVCLINCSRIEHRITFLRQGS